MAPLSCCARAPTAYEGQVILRELANTLPAQAIQGRLIAMPSLNMPAVRDDARVSPLDGGDLNRVFPGAPDQGPTAAIAGFVAEVILRRCARLAQSRLSAVFEDLSASGADRAVGATVTDVFSI